MLILLSAVNEGIGACFVGAFEDTKVSQILELPKDVRPIGIIWGYPAEKPEKLERIDVKALVHYEKYGRKPWTELDYCNEFTYKIKFKCIKSL
jgi:nitroreductase